MTTQEFKKELKSKNTIDSLIALRKAIGSTKFMSETSKKIDKIAKKKGYIMKNVSYNVAENFIGGGYVLARKKNFVVKNSKVLSDFNGEKIKDAFVCSSDGRGNVSVLILV